MTKADLIEQLAKHASLTKKAARESVEGTFGLIRNALSKGDKVVISGFGTFKVRSRAARPGRNPQTGSSLRIPAKKLPGFTAGKSLKRVVK